MTATRSKITPIALALLTIVGLAVLACGRSEALANNEGNDAFYNEEYDEARQQYETAQSEAPDLPEPIYNSASVHYRNSDYESAGSDLQQALLEADEDLAQSSLFNQGNAFFRTAEMEKAIESYKEVLRRNPDDQDAKYNLELALRELRSGPNEGETAPDEEIPEEGEQPSGGEQPGEGQGDQGQDGEQGDEEESDQGSPDQSDEPGGDQSPEQQDPNPADQSEQGRLDEQQARRLLESVGQGTETLQGHLQRIFVSPEDEPARDW